MGYTKEEKAMIWLDGFLLDYAKKAAVLKMFRDPYAAVSRFFEKEREIGAVVGEEMLEKMRASLYNAAYLQGVLSAYEREGIACVTCFSEDYPEALRAADEPPFILYCKGDLALLHERKFAIVGSRRTPPQAAKRTERIAGAVESGRIICVLAFGFSHLSSAENGKLLERVAERGLLVTEYAPAQSARKYTFPARNRIIAGLAEGVLVVSGGEKSGTRITARYAYDFGRDVFAFPYAIGDPMGAGCNQLIKDYAKLTEDLVDITSVFGINLTEKESETLSPAEQQVYDCFGGAPLHISEIAAKTGKKEHELSPVLIMLAMKKKLVSCGGNRWAKT